MKLIALSLLVSMAGVATAQDTPLQTAEPKPLRVSVFKNGFSFVHGQLAGVDDEGSYEITPIPPATLGTFWLGWNEGSEIENLRTTEIETRRDIPAFHVPQLLNANEGNVVDLYIKDEWKRVMIQDVPENESAAPQDGVVPGPVPGEGKMVVVRVDETITAIPIRWVEAVRFPEGNGTLAIEQIEQKSALAFDLVRHRENNPIRMSYMAQGLSWSPSYVVNIDNEDEAVITSKALLINDLTPLENVAVELIAGFPHFQHSGTLEPLTRHSTAGSLATESADRYAGLSMSNTMQEDVMMRRSMPGMPVQNVAGEQTEDLFFFMLDNVSLKQGERGYYQLFTDQVPYETVFTWDVPNFVTMDQVYRDDLAMNTPPVWHTVKLTNETSVPWTAAPAMTEKEGRVLGQDTILFTPVGGEMPLKITQAVMIKGEQKEVELNRQPNAIQEMRFSYDLVTIRGELKLTSFRGDTVPVEITKTVSGVVNEESFSGEVTRMPGGLRSINPTSELKWEVDLDSGLNNAVTLTYEYQVYVRR